MNFKDTVGKMPRTWCMEPVCKLSICARENFLKYSVIIEGSGQPDLRWGVLAHGR